MPSFDPPALARVIEAGAAKGAAQRAGLLIHGRDRSPEEMIELAAGLALPDAAQVRWLAPAIQGGSWYPGRFFDPIQTNFPYISNAFEIFDQLMDDVREGGRLPSSQLIVLGFSQGACLALEYAVRNLGRARSIISFTGGLFGSPGALWPAYPRPLARSRIFISGSDVDDWIPFERTQETAKILAGLGANVTLKIYAGRPHVVCDQELEDARAFLSPP